MTSTRCSPISKPRRRWSRLRASPARTRTSSQPAPEEHVHEDLHLPEIWRTERSVLCVPGRGALDGVAAAMLAQLLRKHGLGAQAAPRDAASRSGIGGLDPTRVAMVCITYVELMAARRICATFCAESNNDFRSPRS